MDKESKINFIKETTTSWIVLKQNENELGSITIKIVKVSEHDIILEVLGNLIQIIIPSSSDEVFLVITVGSESDHTIQNLLARVNEKLERMVVHPNSLTQVLECLLVELTKHCSKQGNEIRNSKKARVEQRASDIDSEKVAKGFIYTMAMAAKEQCESVHNTFMQFCLVEPDPRSWTVHLVIHAGGIITDDVALGLGLFPTKPLSISLQFDSTEWFRGDHGSSKYQIKIQSCTATQKSPACCNVSAETDLLWLKEQKHVYGTEVLLPELIQAYTEFYNGKKITVQLKTLSPELETEIHNSIATKNYFVGLLFFLCFRLSALPNWCVICWNSIPYTMCHIRTCSSDFCLFRFEELGLGTPLLQELHQSPEVLDFQFSIAFAAAESSKDVFEPFPTFLLQEHELRGRSGFFDHNFVGGLSSGQKQSYENKNLKLLRGILLSYPPVHKMKECRDETQLRKILLKFWEDYVKAPQPEFKNEFAKLCKDFKPSYPYNVVRFILSTSRFSLHPMNPGEAFQTENAVYQFAILHDSPEREAYFQQQRVQNGGSFFAFHGSEASNWFSILRNGLRCLSNTSMMRNGASCGPGIYLASNATCSLTYSKPGTGFNMGKLSAGFCVLAICEVVNGSTREMNVISRASIPPGIMVVPPENEKNVVIRYILVLRSPCISHPFSIRGTTLSSNSYIDLSYHYKSLCSRYHKSKHEKIQLQKKTHWDKMSTVLRTNEGEFMMQPSSNDPKKDVEDTNIRSPRITVNSTCVYSSSAMKAIVREYKNVQKQIKGAKEQNPMSEHILSGIQVILPEENDICRWHLILCPFLFNGFALYDDLIDCAKALNISEIPIKLESIFPPDYPFAPPFIRVISPIFSFHTGHVTVGGSICMELLTKSGWSPVYSFESVLVQIVNAIVEGGGRLDKNACMTRKEYSEDEARAAFIRVARQHGWATGL